MRKAELAEQAARQPGVRREGDREVPAGPKAQRTRESLLKAAYDLFTTKGYIATSVNDITDSAGVSLGTFYQYFRDRSEVVAALLHAHTAGHIAWADKGWRPEEGWGGLFRVVHGFVAWYAEEAAFAKVWEEVCHVDEQMANLRREVGRVFTDSVERQLVRASKAGVIRPLAPRSAALAARALTGMADRFCYVTYVFDPPPGGPPTADVAARVLTDLWASAIGLNTE